jgi:hypothetical protein
MAKNTMRGVHLGVEKCSPLPYVCLQASLKTLTKNFKVLFAGFTKVCRTPSDIPCGPRAF